MTDNDDDSDQFSDDEDIATRLLKNSLKRDLDEGASAASASSDDDDDDDTYEAHRSYLAMLRERAQQEDVIRFSLK